MTNQPQNKLSDEVIGFLYGLEAMDGYDRVIEAQGLEVTDDVVLSQAVESVLRGEDKMSSWPSFLMADLEIDEVKAKQIAADLAGNLLVPLSAFVPDVNEAITSFGGDPSAFASLPKVEKKVEDVAAEAKSVAAGTGDILADPVLQGRLELILVKYLSGELNRGASVELMKRPPKVGGLGVTPDQAEGFLNSADEAKATGTEDFETETFVSSSVPVEDKTAVEEKSPEKTPSPSTPRRAVTADSSDQPSVPPKQAQPKTPDAINAPTVDKRTVASVPRRASKDAIHGVPSSASKRKKKPKSPPPAPPAGLPVEPKTEKTSDVINDVPTVDKRTAPLTPESINKPLPEKTFPVPPADLLDPIDPETMPGPGAVAADAPTMTAAPAKPSLKELRKQARASQRTRNTRRDSKDATHGVPPSTPRRAVTADSSGQPSVPPKRDQPRVLPKQDKPKKSGRSIDVKTVFKIGKEPAKPEKAGAEVDVFSEEDEKEIAEIRKQTPKAAAATSSDQQFSSKIAAEAGLDLSDETIKGRFKAVVDSRRRDLRDVYETRNQLEDSVEKGGLGISGEQLAKTVEVLERYIREENEKAASKLQTEQQEKKATRKKQEADKDVELQGREQQVLAKRYAKITGQAPTKGVGVGGQRASAARSREQALSAQEAQIDTDKVRQAVNGVKADRPVPRMSEATIAPKEGRRRVQDVRFERRLAGPIEELKALTLTSFRRLSGDSKQAAAKVKDKIDLLGFEDRVSAIRAWRESPLNQQYVSLAQESLTSGKAIPEVIKQQEAQGGETLTQEEVAAIVSLNGQLRF